MRVPAAAASLPSWLLWLTSCCCATAVCGASRRHHRSASGLTACTRVCPARCRLCRYPVASGGIKLGPQVGQGTVRFSSAEDARRALINLNGQYMGSRYIELFFAS